MILPADGEFPNNPKLPLLVYPGAFLPFDGSGLAAEMEDCFHANGWPAAWRNGVYDFHHYHALAHEVLGIYSGSAKVQFGGPNGPVMEVETGDAVLLPAGISHKRVESSHDFAVVGAYPPGQHPDMCYGEPGERPNVDRQICRVPFPKTDPVMGDAGGVVTFWHTDG